MWPPISQSHQHQHKQYYYQYNRKRNQSKHSNIFNHMQSNVIKLIHSDINFDTERVNYVQGSL